MTPPAFQLPRLATAKHILGSYDTFLFDADGVLWRDENPLPGAIDLVKQLSDVGKRVIILTNNSSRDPVGHAEKAKRLGFSNFTSNDVCCPSLILVDQLEQMKKDPKFASKAHLPIFLIGPPGLENFLRKRGIESIGTGPDPMPDGKLFTLDNASDFVTKEPVLAVIGSFDSHISFPKIMKAVNYLHDDEMPFFVTNEDARFPGKDPNIVIPGAGTVTSMLRYVSGREPIVMGKPSSFCWDYICKNFGGSFTRERTLMIGDRCETDIQFGRNSGLSTLLVLTGVSSMEDVKHFAMQGKQSLIPEFFVQNLKELL
uniref:Uncharacterized protein n=1 Tax=Meloidogyne incognita TaxID=6306 RepID=A0A914M288_MELIC